MSKFLELVSVEANDAISVLFNGSPHVLVEVRFPGSGASSDWYLCDDPQELVETADKLGAGVELHYQNSTSVKALD